MVYLTVKTPGQPPRQACDSLYDFWKFNDLMDAVGYILSMNITSYELSDTPDDPEDWYELIAPHSTERV